MSSNFGLRGPKTSWVCPNDRQLALRAKLRAGWSVKTNQFNTYPKPQPLTDKEQQAIVDVIKRAEELDLYEQHRVGKLVDRLESLKRLASGNGVTECVLCGDSFGLSVFGRTYYRCADCDKAVCRKCVVDLASTTTTTTTGTIPPSRRSGGIGNYKQQCIIHLCKLCSENREFIKKSGAWFYKGVPTYILPEKKNNVYGNSYESVPMGSGTSYQEQRYVSRYITDSKVSNSLSSSTANKRAGGVFWSKSLSQQERESDDENSSSSEEDDEDDDHHRHHHHHHPHQRSTRSTPGSNNNRKSNFRLRLNSGNPGSSSSSTKINHGPSPGNTNKSSGSPFTESSGDGDDKSLYQISEPTLTEGSSGIFHKSFERFDVLSSSDYSTSVLIDNNPHRSSGSSSSVSDGHQSSNTNLYYSNSHHHHHLPQLVSTDLGLGNMELSILYDDTQQALHCSIHRAMEITPMDINGLSDPFVMLKLIPTRHKGTHLRTKTVQKTLQPIFNETLTFYGVTQHDMARQSLEMNMMDDDDFGKECLGSLQIPLHRIRSQQTRFFSLRLDRPNPSEDEDEWGRGRILLSLCYVTDQNALIVGVIKASDLPALDHCGTSDPFVKVRLVQDLNNPIGSSNSTMQKYKTSTKWKTLNPEFKEEFNFKVSLNELEQLSLVISVWDKDLGKRNDYIGGIVLSSSSKGERLKHWIDMIKIQNIKHPKWHSLSPTSVTSIRSS